MCGAWSAGSNLVGAGVVWMWGVDACVALRRVHNAATIEPCVIQIPLAVCAQTQTTRKAGALAHYHPEY